jgi:hypothetical protein
MGWEGIAALAAVGAVLISVLGIVFVWGKLVSRLEALEKRVEEDRENNCADHKEFATTVVGVSNLAIKMENLGEKIGEIKTTMQAILSHLSGGAKI